MAITHLPIVTYTDGEIVSRKDEVVTESPLEILVNGRPAYYCMRMPGMDRELAAGLCYHDGRIGSDGGIISVTQQDKDTVSMEIDESHGRGPEEMQIIRSSSGTFRKDRDSLERPRAVPPAQGDGFPASLLFTLQEDFFSRQEVFTRTGGTHAAALYERNGNLLAFAEDVGRHNALDKCVGRLLLEGDLAAVFFCMLSSRLSYEMVMKSGRAGAQVIAGASAPTDLAVRVAAERGVTLVGFLRKPRFNVYTGEERLLGNMDAGPSTDH